MFFQGLVGLLLLVGAAFVIWKFVIAPGLKGAGIDIDAGDDEDIKTDHTKQRDKIKKQHAETEASADAVEESLELKKEIKDMNKDIKKAEKKMKKL